MCSYEVVFREYFNTVNTHWYKIQLILNIFSSALHSKLNYTRDTQNACVFIYT
jgi:hypothetical protein